MKAHEIYILDAYVRCSTDDQKNSISMQPVYINMFFERFGFQLGVMLTDEDVSAGIPFSERPNGSVIYNRLLTGQSHGVVSIKVDRMFRDAVDGLNVARMFNEKGFRMYFTEFGDNYIDISTYSGYMQFGLQLLMAEGERIRVKERTSAVLQHMKKSGRIYSSEPFGFTAIDGRNVPNESEQETIRQILAYHALGKSLTWIAGQLNSLHIKPKRAICWTHGLVGRVIRNNLTLTAQTT